VPIIRHQEERTMSTDAKIMIVVGILLLMGLSVDPIYDYFMN
jgi:hypothetical protein